MSKGDMMKNLRRYSLVVLFCTLFVSSISFSAFVPTWAGAPTSTRQLWTFDAPGPPGAPALIAPADEFENPFGLPPLAIVDFISVGMYPPTAQVGGWMQFDYNHQGVVRLFDGDSISLIISNDPEPRPFKEVYVTVTYSAADGLSNSGIFLAPGVPAILAEAPEVVNTEVLDDFYVRETTKYVITPNPAEEMIVIYPRFCRTYIDEIEVWTNCVPEPASIAMLAFGGAVIFRRRKK